MATASGPPRRRSLEREIIIAVIVLYLMITGDGDGPLHPAGGAGTGDVIEIAFA